jgi:hypothetical protein
VCEDFLQLTGIDWKLAFVSLIDEMRQQMERQQQKCNGKERQTVRA